jgi:mannose-6-phosphate isomerase-like protein (cupin superfamily)
MTTPIRRIVTGHNEAGRSIILMDGPAPNYLPLLFSPKAVGSLLWITDSAPATNSGDKDTAPAGLRVPTPPQHRGGTVFRVTDFPPDSEYGDTSQITMAKHGAQVSEQGRERHFLYHKTNTVDYAIVLEGEIWAIVDEDEVLMKAGDVLIQRGTAHAWSNRSDKVCRMAFILIDAQPLDSAT